MIVCAALQLKEHPDTVIGCVRHGDGFSVAHDLRPDLAGNVKWEQGFLTSNGEFLNRKEAFLHAWECGQLSANVRYYKTENNEEELYSEDLY